ncbi:MAG: hypothetical protein SNF33_04660 [Candidatus Algichlamydia australiensis]|nr:hypothetical protein [Chlamydiales bacterium]
MSDPTLLEETFTKFMQEFPKCVPDGIISVDLKLLRDLGLLDAEEDEEDSEEFPHQFHVIETDEKVTLFNEEFAIWIVPKIIDELPTTLTLISLLSGEKPKLEIVFSTSGIYNTPKFVLKVLRYYLSEVLDTEEAISSIHKD